MADGKEVRPQDFMPRFPVYHGIDFDDSDEIEETPEQIEERQRREASQFR
jgi:hypothetical protein